jgi:adhesin/invasin
VTANVKNGAVVSVNVSGDPVQFTLTANITGGCGTLSVTSGITDGSGNVTTVYTSSVKSGAGSCTITAFEASDGQNGTDAVNQAAVPNTITATANPAAIPANGTSTSTITATVKDVSGAAVNADTLTFTRGAAPCNIVPPAPTATTNSSGIATNTYTSSSTQGFCTITITDVGGGSTTVTITQTAPPVPAAVAVSANPASIAATGPGAGATTSLVTATVTDTSGAPVSGDPVLFTAPGAACGVLSGATSPTDSAGKATATYTSSVTVGSCTVTVAESKAGLSGSTSIAQTKAPNSIALTPKPVLTLADGASATTITATVMTGLATGSTAVSGDVVTFTLSGTPPCGTLSSTSGTTGAGGTVTTVYTASLTVGFCTITATEAGTGSSDTDRVDQRTNPLPATTYAVTLAPSPVNTTADGTSTTTVTANVKNGAVVSVNVSGDPVQFTLTAVVTGGCGTLSVSSGTTDGSGNVTTVYTSSTKAASPSCTITAFEASDGQNSAGDSVNQAAVKNTFSVTANPPAIQANGSSTSTVTATVTNGVTGVPVKGDSVTFTTSGGASCGTFTTASTVVTDASGVASVTYQSSTGAGSVGFCTITASDTGPPPGSGTALITQTT